MWRTSLASFPALQSKGYRATWTTLWTRLNVSQNSYCTCNQQSCVTEIYQEFLWPRKQVSQPAWHSALPPWQLWFLCTTVSSASDQDLSMPRSLGTDNPTGLPEQPRQGQLALKRLQIQAREVAKGGHAVIGYEFEGVWIKQPLYPPDRQCVSRIDAFFVT